MNRMDKSMALTERLARSERGSVLVEFALLTPVFITLLMGILQVGLHVQNANAVRNLASDGARFAVVQYQLDRVSTTDIIETWIQSRGIGDKYNLTNDRLGVTVTEASVSRITGAREMQISVSYQAPNYLAFVDGAGLDITYTRPVFLLDS
jgi:Flp pilus assembly protein TadG